MNPNEPAEGSESLDKGKRRAQVPTEYTPLLGGVSSSSYIENAPTTPEASSRRLRSKLTFVFLVSLSICIVAFIVVVLLGWTYAAKISQISGEDLVLRGPERVNVVKVTGAGELWVDVDIPLGFDAGSAIGVHRDSVHDSIIRSLWKSIGRWGIRRLDRVTVSLTNIRVISDHDPSTTLATINVEPMVVRLAADPPPGKSWLTTTSMSIRIQPTNDTSALLHFLRHSWNHGYIIVRANVERTSVQGGSFNEISWRDVIYREVVNLWTTISLQIPPLPGLPHPGKNTPFPSISDLITLKSFGVHSEANKLVLHALATIIDPAPPLDFTSPPIPFVISLPPASNSSPSAPIPVASVSTAPFTLTYPNITLDISGHVLPLAIDATSSLSSFMSRYLSSQPNPIVITSPLFPALSVGTVFPAPHPKPQILRNVTIRNMKIKPGNTFLASGTVAARIVLPKGIDVGLDVSRILPDVLIFDGEIPEPVANAPPPPPLPDPLPEKAFGRIRPEDWLESTSVRDKSGEGQGAVYAVTADIVDVPLEVLPGRQKEFSNFVSKILFGTDGAVAGLLGSAAVAVGVEGLPFPGPAGEMELSGLPFQGSVRVGKKTLFADNVAWDWVKRHLFGDDARRSSDSWIFL